MAMHRSTATLAGILFLVAMAASLVGGGLLESAIGGDPVAIASANATIAAGVMLELINVVAVVAIAVVLFTPFREHSERLALGYLGVRILEATVLMLAAVVAPILLGLGRNAIATGGEIASAPTTTALLLATRNELTGLLAPILFSLGAVFLYTWLYRTQLVPRWLSLWGFVSVALIFAVNLIDVGTVVTLAFALPIILNEIVLGVWLIVRGFDVDKGIGEREPPEGVLGAI